MKDSYKSLHNEWKATKKSAKNIYSFWDRMFTDMSKGHQDVKFGAPQFPKFNLKFGPSLDNLEANKKVDKSKPVAVKAVKQYYKDIKTFKKAYEKLTPPEGVKDSKKIHKLMGDRMNELEDIILRTAAKLAAK